MALDPDAFRKKEAGIYARSFDPANRAQKGIVPSPALEKGQSGYLIALRHRLEVVDVVSAFSDRIASQFPAITYHADNLHTTVATFGVQDGLLTPDRSLLNHLVRRTSWVRTVFLDYDFSGKSLWLASPDTVVAAGKSPDAFIDLVSFVIHAEKEDIPLNPTWGSHLTATRFTEARSSADIADLSKLLAEGPSLGKPAARSLDIGYFLFDKTGFRYNVEKSITF